MGQYGQSEDRALERLLRRLDERIKALETATPLRNAAISDGGQLSIRGTNGAAMVLLGRYDVPGYETPDGRKQMVVGIWRDTGELAFELVDAEPAIDGFHQYWSFFDTAGNRVVGDDATSGQGLARPWLPAVFTDYPTQPSAAQSTTSSSWTSVQRCAAYVKQHPRLTAGVLALTETGTTGDVRLWDATHGVQIGSTVSVPAFTFQGYNIGPAALQGEHMEGIDIDLQVRRTSGAGSIGAYVTTAYGIQS